MSKANRENKEKYTIELTEFQIGIVKAALKYYLLDDNFGYSLWSTMPYASFGSSDYFYSRNAINILEKLDSISKADPDFGYWGNLERLFELAKTEFTKAKLEGEEALERIENDWLELNLQKLSKLDREDMLRLLDYCSKKEYYKTRREILLYLSKIPTNHTDEELRKLLIGFDIEGVISQMIKEAKGEDDIPF
jgi:hypothetical protein